jgi:hypothetical protein
MFYLSVRQLAFLNNNAQILVLSQAVVLRLWETINLAFSLTIWCLSASSTGLVTNCTVQILPSSAARLIKKPIVNRTRILISVFSKSKLSADYRLEGS